MIVGYGSHEKLPVANITAYVGYRDKEKWYQFLVKSLVLKHTCEPKLLPIANENVHAEQDGKNQVGFVKQVGAEKQNGTDDNPPVAFAFGIVEEQQHPQHEQQKAEMEIEVESGGRAETAGVDDGIENEKQQGQGAKPLGFENPDDKRGEKKITS